jgi:predicted metal-dependent HD superfamily phosphohydrolase
MTDALANGPIRLPDAWWDALKGAYATPPRRYHTFDHVVEVAKQFHAVAADTGWAQPAEVWLAVLHHDAVYEIGRPDNEARSAELARALIQAHGAHADADRVAALIQLTAAHGHLGPSDVDADTALFLDCDMAILGAAPAVFDAYDEAVAAEWAPVLPPEAWAVGRGRFLHGLLAAERIFLSDRFHRLLDAPARANLARAAAKLA